MIQQSEKKITALFLNIVKKNLFKNELLKKMQPERWVECEDLSLSSFSISEAK